MPHHQKIDEIRGQRLWVETWSWSESSSPILPIIYTTIGGEITVWFEQPSERKPTPLWQKILCSLPPFDVFCLIAGAISTAVKNRKRWDGQAEISLANTYYDRAGLTVHRETKICKGSYCEQHESAVGFGYINYPELGANLMSVVTVKTEAVVNVPGQPLIHHETWAGPFNPLP